MSSTNDANRFALPDNLTQDWLFSVGDAVGVGDLMYDNGSDVARPADKQADQGSLAANQLYFAQRFCGVSQQQVLSAETNATKRVTLRTEGVMEFACQSATFKRGDRVGIDENDGGDACNPQRVIAVTDQAKAIGVVIKNYASAVTRVLVYVKAARTTDGTLGQIAPAGVDGSGTTAGQAGRDVDLRAGNGGAKTGTGAAAGGAGGAADVTSGNGGNTASSGSDAGGAAGNVNLTGGTGGNATAGTGNGGAGGSIIQTPGAGGTSAGGTAGKAGGIFQRSSGGQFFRQQTAATAKADGNQSVTAAQMINGIVVFTITTGRTLTTPTGAALVAGCPADLAAGDSFDFTLITVGTGSDDIATLTAGDGDVTFVGQVTVGPDIAATEGLNNFGTWRFRYAGTNAWVGYRIG